jgi:hypothetical protein
MRYVMAWVGHFEYRKMARAAVSHEAFFSAEASGPRRRAGPGQEVHHLREGVHGLVVAHAPGVDPGVDADAQVPVQLALELVDPLLRRVEPARVLGLRLRHEVLRVEAPSLRGHGVLPHRGRALHLSRRQPPHRPDLVAELRHHLEVPVVAGEALVRGEVGDGRLVVLLELGGIALGGRDVEPAQAMGRNGGAG